MASANANACAIKEGNCANAQFGLRSAHERAWSGAAAALDLTMCLVIETTGTGLNTTGP